MKTKQYKTQKTMGFYVFEELDIPPDTLITVFTKDDQDDVEIAYTLNSGGTFRKFIAKELIDAGIDFDLLIPVDMVQLDKRKCICTSKDLFNFGCRCGAIDRYKPPIN